MTRRIRVIVPVPMDEAGVANRAAQLPSDLVLPGFEPTFVSVRTGARLADSYYETLLMDMTITEAGLSAEADGCDAVCIDTVSDSGLLALRSRLSIPVLGPGQVAFHTACMLGHRFSIVSMWDTWFPLYRESLTRHGLWPRLASMRSIDTRPDLNELLAGKEEILFPRLEAQCRAAIEEDGAAVIVLGSTTMHQSHPWLAERLPVPVVNPGLVMYKQCELLLQLGLTHSKRAYPPPETPQDGIFHSLRVPDNTA